MKKKYPLVKLENAGVFRENKWLVRGVFLEINHGDIVTLIGPNGSGKSTTGKIILNILKPTQGKMTIKTNKIAYVPQKIDIDWSIPLRVSDFMNITSSLNKDEIINHLKMTEVDHLTNRSLVNLSGGEFQRVLIARAISKQPELLVLDEPVQGVDFKGEIALYELIKKISDKMKCGILLISHDLHVVMSATDYVLCLNGHVCCSGTPHHVVQDSKYKELFGDRASNILSLYEHKHDHTHSPDGTIDQK